MHQESELNEKLERLSELNALLNMDEKGAGDSLEEQEADAPLSGKADARTSIMEKLAQFKEQSSQMGIGNNKTEKKQRAYRRTKKPLENEKSK